MVRNLILQAIVKLTIVHFVTELCIAHFLGFLSSNFSHVGKQAKNTPKQCNLYVALGVGQNLRQKTRKFTCKK